MCGNTYQNACDEVKAIASKETMLHYPNYGLPILMFPDASDMQLEDLVSYVKDANVDIKNFDDTIKRDNYPALLHSRKSNEC